MAANTIRKFSAGLLLGCKRRADNRLLSRLAFLDIIAEMTEGGYSQICVEYIDDKKKKVSTKLTPFRTK